MSDAVPSEAIYSRVLTELSELNVLRLIHQASKEGFIMDDTVAIDATHFETSD